MSSLNKFSLWLVVGFVVFAAGCGGPTIKEGNFKVFPVTGKVTLNNAPLADADVMFMMQGNAPADYYGSAGKTDAQGNFEIITGGRKGAPAGTYKVVVSKWVGKDGKVPDASAGIDLEQLKLSGDATQSVPAAYSDITMTKIPDVTVVEGKETPPLTINAE